MRRLILVVVLVAALGTPGRLQATNLPLPAPNRIGPHMNPGGLYPTGPCSGLENVGLGPHMDPGGFYPTGGPILGTCGSAGTDRIGPLVEPNGSAGTIRIGPLVEPGG